MGPFGQPPIIPIARQIAGQQESYPPLGSIAQKQPTISLDFTLSSFQTLIPPAVYPQRSADHRRSTLHSHCPLLAVHSLKRLLCSTLTILCSAFRASARSIATSLIRGDHRSPVRGQSQLSTASSSLMINDLRTTACSLCKFAGLIEDRNCSPFRCPALA